MENTQCNVNSWALLEAHFLSLLICSGCRCHFINLIFKDCVEDAYCGKTFESLSFVVNWFNFRKCIFLPMLHGQMTRLFGTVYALLTYVSTRFSSNEPRLSSNVESKKII